MKKILLISIFTLFSFTYTNVNQKVLLMLPQARQSLANANKEVADTYKSLGRTNKANQFYQAALNIYPVGDQAHQVASMLKTNLNDDQTYTNQISSGDQAVTNKKHDLALAYYLMALEVYATAEAYNKIANSYEQLSNSTQAAYYRNLAESVVEGENPQEEQDYLKIQSQVQGDTQEQANEEIAEEEDKVRQVLRTDGTVGPIHMNTNANDTNNMTDEQVEYEDVIEPTLYEENYYDDGAVYDNVDNFLE